jgi:P-type Mg2+ transporter
MGFKKLGVTALNFNAAVLLPGLISGITRETVNAAIIFTIVLISVVLDFYQETKAEKASDLLKEKVATTANSSQRQR